MQLFSIDSDKCKRCGACSHECPIKIVSLPGDDQVPVAVAELVDLCINCGHCVAVCPEAAFSHKNASPADCLEVNKEWLLSSERAEHFMRYRRSIRSYKKKPVDRKVLEKLIDIARYAPSGHNTQPVRWAVIYDSDELRRLTAFVVDWMKYMVKEQPAVANLLHMDLIIQAHEMGLDIIMWDAPHVIVCFGHEENPMAPDSCTIALTHLELAAPSLNLGACWAGFFQIAAKYWPPLKQALPLPEKHVVNGAMMVGYPKFKYHRMPPRNEVNIIWK